MIDYEDLTPAHFVEWGYLDHPHPDRLLGFACRRDGELVAIGFVAVDAEDRWWGGFGSRPGFPAGIHRKTLELFGALTRAGVPEIRALLDRSVPRSREWLVRLGFSPVDDSEMEWTLGLHRRCAGNGGPVQVLRDAGEGREDRG